MRYVFLISLCLALPQALCAQSAALPAAVAAEAHSPLQPVGEGNYRKLGFRIYNATLWAPGGVWNKNAPFALQLRYARTLSQETLVDAVVDNIREQKVADAPTFARWEKFIRANLPAVQEGDELVGVAVPGKNSKLFFNGKPIATLTEKALSDAFFAIWLGPTADTTLQAQLLGENGR